jgi:hypothetical protein
VDAGTIHFPTLRRAASVWYLRAGGFHCPATDTRLRRAPGGAISAETVAEPLSERAINSIGQGGNRDGDLSFKSSPARSNG